MFRKLLQRISSLFQGATESYKRHNRQYEAPGKLERDQAAGLDNLKNDLINGPEMRVRDLLEQYPFVRHAIDVGSGTGWSAAALSPLMERVIGIEPSQAAIEISQKAYPIHIYPNIVWIQGLAEEVIPTLSLSTPTFFLTGCVLSHIRDQEVKTICTAITKAAPAGSILSFAECWGEESWHQLMWHVRTKDWWREQFPGWELDFHGPVVPDTDTYKGQYRKGFWGVKK